MTMLLPIEGCCTRAMFDDEPYCPVCRSQEASHREERQRAAAGGDRAVPGEVKARALVERRMVPVEELGGSPTLRREVLGRHPARLAVFKLLGIYLPEAEARALLTEVHRYKWIVAEKAGEDVWKKKDPRNPFGAAAREWATAYLDAFLRWWRGVQSAEAMS